MDGPEDPGASRSAPKEGPFQRMRYLPRAAGSPGIQIHAGAPFRQRVPAQAGRPGPDDRDAEGARVRDLQSVQPPMHDVQREFLVRDTKISGETAATAEGL